MTLWKILVGSALILLSANAVQAQYTIPDTAFAAYLNDHYSGIMTGNVLDTVQAANVIDIHAQSYGITDLSGLQYFTGLIQLLCYDNQLTQLPHLPSSLRVLYCYDNDLTSLPVLPDLLNELFVHNNELTFLPSLPDTLTVFGCQSNQLTSLPELPSRLWYLGCSDNVLDCLPVLPDSLEWLDCVNTNVTCLPNLPLDLDLVQSDLDFPAAVCNILSPCPFFEGLVTGSVFLDANGNGIKDIGEPPIGNVGIEAQPGGYLTAAEFDGHFVLPMDSGTFILDGQELLYHIKTTSPHNVNLSSSGVDSLNHIGYQIIPDIYDLVVDVTADPARPGFDNNVYLEVQNFGTEITDVVIAFTYGSDQIWVSSSITPDSLIGNTAYWNITLNLGEVWSATVVLFTPISTPLGTPITHVLVATPQVPDQTPVDNTAIWNDEVVGSYDPNDKLMDPETMLPVQIINGEFIEYTIRFQNTGTFPAVRVVITDTLSSDLDWSSMEFISSSHECTWYLQNGVLHFIHDPIFLPDSNSNEPESHGFVKFRMKPVSTLMIGEQIENIANIYFDFNEPVITDPAIFEVSVPTEISEFEDAAFEMYPNPTNGNVTIVSGERMAQVTVLLLDGRTMLKTATQNDRVSLNLSHLARGMYLIQIEDHKGLRSSKLLLKE